MNLKELKEKRNQKVDEIDNLVKNALKEERAMTDEEISKFDKIKEDVDDMNETIKRVEDLEKAEVTEDSSKSDEETEEEKEKENRATSDIASFANFIRNTIEQRADVNLTKGANGSIVPTTIADKIITKAYDISPIIERATKYTQKGKVGIPSIGLGDDAINMVYAEEFKELESKSKNFDSVTLEGFLSGALCKISNSLINSTDIELVNKVVELMATDYARFIEKEGIYGTTNKITGCSDAKLIVNAASSVAITVDELIDLKNKVKQVYRKNAFYVMNQETKGIVEKLKDKNGNYLFNSNVSGPFDGTILGYPVFVSDAVENVEAGKIPVLFGDFSGLALKESKEMEVQILREIFATQHATGVVLWAEPDVKIENYQKIAKLKMPNA